MKAPNERLGEVLWHIHSPKAVLRYDLEEMVASWQPADMIQARMRELEDTTLAPLIEEAEEILLAERERDHSCG
jgi:hypothetical protein